MEYLGLSASTGAFAVGVLLAGNRYRPQIQADIIPFEGILLGIFFHDSGRKPRPRPRAVRVAHASHGHSGLPRHQGMHINNLIIASILFETWEF